MEYGFVKVTPKQAAEWLKLNKKNRKLRDGVVKKYASDMRSGRWEEGNADPIVINSDGVHRDESAAEGIVTRWRRDDPCGRQRHVRESNPRLYTVFPAKETVFNGWNIALFPQNGGNGC